MNYDKTIAFSLSGQPSPSWRTIIFTAHISQWHGRTSDEPLKYLGYPIIYSHSQRQIFLSDVVARLKRSCDTHKCRNLSVRGRATVLNTLLLSKIWHVLRVTWIPKKTLDKITSIGRQFVQHHQFPYISYDVLLQPTQRGGLGLLDPAIQQSLLAYRWLTPFLLSEAPSAIVATWMSAHILSTASFTLPDGRLPFFFPSLRQGLLHPSRPSLCSLWFRAFDILPGLQKHKLSLETDMSQPTPISASVSMDAFIFDPQLQFIRRRLTAEEKRVVKRGRNRVVRLYQLLDSHSVCLSLFLSRLMLPSQIGLHDGTLGQTTIDDTILPLVTPLVDHQTQLIQPSHMRKLIRKASLSQAKESSVALGNSVRFWKTFWRMDVPLPARNVWFRLIHEQIKLHANWSLASNTFEDYYYRPRNQHKLGSDIVNTVFGEVTKNITASEVGVEAT
ncbi:hypothetical protein BCV72DRAFT_338757 [Rhizopus microsporus var. microsporus]|uniref:Uncharacterized protein n=1 Tax=Rhizopus microsporus var. microsporus TaxID=86635 RepID=A0A1X0QRI3_RHIZD|nr:hypothetical protein BCV72DRAFT_338757 [Rhizopus microsporus var. microsporus]